jgi:MATE family multidrug resistance protein
MCGWLGELELASHQIAINLASIAFMTITGISAAGTIMTGYSFGAKDSHGIRINGNSAILLTIMLELVFVVFFFTLHKVLPSLYTDNPEVIAMASSLILLAVFFQVSDGLQNVAVGVLRGIQDVRVPAIIAFVSYWMIMIPACYLLAFKVGLGVRGIWFGFIIGLSVAAILLTLRFRFKTTMARNEMNEL